MAGIFLLVQKEVARELRKFGYLSRIFLTKAAELVISRRDVDHNIQFSEDRERWFSFDQPLSSAVRQRIQTSALYGWFNVEVLAPQTEIPLEKWVFVNSPLRESRKIFLEDTELRRCKHCVYRQFEHCLRSICSILSFLPFNSLAHSFVPLTFVIHLSEFMAFPLLPENESELETSLVRFGPVKTPASQVDVYCTYVVDATQFIPRIIRAAPHYRINPHSPSPSISMEDYQKCDENLRLVVTPGLTLDSFRSDIEMYPDGFIPFAGHKESIDHSLSSDDLNRLENY